MISDDNSRPEWLAAIREVLGGDERFVLVPSEVRRGFYGNFERALALAPPEAGYLALSDQDDRWTPTSSRFSSASSRAARCSPTATRGW